MSLDLPPSFNHFGPQLVFLVLLCSIGIVTRAPILHLPQGLIGTVLQLVSSPEQGLQSRSLFLGYPLWGNT